MSESVQMYWFDSKGEGRNRFAVFRRVFDLAETPQSALFHIFADSLYRLIVNGRVCGYGPARFLPKYPEFDSYDVAPFLVAGMNEFVIEINARGASSFQAVPSHGGAAAWGGWDGFDLSFPGGWTVHRSRQWDPGAAAFSFAQGPVEVRDFRVSEEESLRPVLRDCNGHWGQMRARSIAEPSLLFVPFPVALTSVVMKPQRGTIGFRCPDFPRGRQPFAAKLFSPVAQSVEARMNWGPVALNGDLLKPVGRTGHIWELVKLDFRAGWNFLSGLVENISPGWIWQMDFPEASGIECGTAAAAEHYPEVFLGPHTLDPAALEAFLADPPAEWDPEGLHAGFQRLEHAGMVCPAREMALDVVDRAESASVGSMVMVAPGETRAFVYDFQGEYLGHPVLKVGGPSGTVVDLGYDERLNDVGLLDFYKCNPFIQSADRFVLDGSERVCEGFHERGGRFLQVTVRVPEGRDAACIETPGIRMTTGSYDVVGTFESDDLLFNWIWRAGSETLLASMADGWIDPWRERGLYIGDALVQGHSTRVLTSDWRLDPWALRLWAHAQRPDGQLPDVVPSHHEEPLNDYTLIWVLALWNYWAATGNQALVLELRETIRRIFASPVWKPDANGLWEATPGMKLFIDWGVVPEERKGVNACLNAFRCEALKCAAELFDAINEKETATRFRAEYQEVAQAFRTHFWIKEERRFASALIGGEHSLGPALHANALALAFGLADATQSAMSVDYLLSGFRPEQMLAPGHCELYFLYFVFKALYRHGRAAEAEAIMRTHYGAMQNMGAWTLWERLDRGLMGKDSMCHGWSTGAMPFLAERILGVRQIEPGNLRSMLVAPCAETVHRASGTVPHPDGPIHVKWSADEESLELEIDGPPGVEFVVAPEGRLSKLRLRHNLEVLVGSGT